MSASIINPIEVLNPNRYWKIGNSKTTGTNQEQYYLRNVKAWDVSLGNNLDVDGVTTLNNNVNINSDITLNNGNFTINSPSSVVDIDANIIDLHADNFNLVILDDISINSNKLNIDTYYGNFNFSDFLNIDANSIILDTSNTTQIKGNKTEILTDVLTISGPTTINNQLTVIDNILSQSNLDVCGNLTVTSNTILNNTVTIDGLASSQPGPHLIVKNSDVSINNDLYLGGQLLVGSEFYIDPTYHGSGNYQVAGQGNTGTVIIRGNLQVEGTHTTINSSILDISDRNITIASTITNKSEADTAGIDISNIYSFRVNTSTDEWVLSGCGLFVDDTNINGESLRVDGKSLFNDYVNINNNLDICGSVNVVNNLLVGGSNITFSGIQNWGNINYDKYALVYDYSNNRVKLEKSLNSSIVSSKFTFANSVDLSTNLSHSTTWKSLKTIFYNDISFKRDSLVKSILVCVKFNYFHSVGFNETMDVQIWRKIDNGSDVNDYLVGEDIGLGSSNATGGTKSVYSTSFIDTYNFTGVNIDNTQTHIFKYYVKYRFPNVQTSTPYYSSLGLIDLPNSTGNRKSASIDLHVL